MNRPDVTRARRPLAALAMALALTVPSAGCSFIFVTKPPAPEERPRNVDCTTSNVAPVIDTLIAGWQVLRTVIALTASESAYANAPIGRGADVGIGIGLFSLFAASAGTGFSWTSDCREMIGDSEPATSRPRPRPRLQPPAGRLGPPPPRPQQPEEAAEETAAQARAAQMAAEQAKAAGMAAKASDPARKPETPGTGGVPALPSTPTTAPAKPGAPARQQADTE